MNVQEAIDITRSITGKSVYFLDANWVQDDTQIVVPYGDTEGLLHEICHWIVASDKERAWPNLFLDSHDFQIMKDLPEEEQFSELKDINDHDLHVYMREKQTCYLQKLIDDTNRLKYSNTACVFKQLPSADEIHWAESRLLEIDPALILRLKSFIRNS